MDAFAFVANTVSAAAVTESLLEFIFPLFGQDTYVKLGYGGGNSLLAGLTTVIVIPFPTWIWYEGEGIRKRNATFLAPDLRPSSTVPLATSTLLLGANNFVIDLCLTLDTLCTYR